MNDGQRTRLNNVLEAAAEGNSTVLDLSAHKLGFSMGAEGVALLAGKAAQFRCLHTLRLNGARITAEGANDLAKASKHWSEIQVLDVEDNGIGADGTHSLASADWDSLHGLNLRGNRIGPAGVKHLAVAARRWSKLESLQLGYNQLGPRGAGYLAEVTRHLPALAILDLSNNFFARRGAFERRGEAAWAIAAAAAQCQRLIALDLDSNALGPDVAKALAGVGNEWRELQSLKLGSNLIEAEGAIALERGGGSWKALAALDLSMGLIGPQGGHAIADAVKNWPVLTTLNLGENEIGPEGVQALSLVATQWGSVTDLDLCYNKLHDSGAWAIASSAEHWRSLARLDLGGNAIGPKGARAIADAVGDWGRLTHLALWRNHIGDDGVEALANRASRLGRLNTLLLDSNGISSRGVKSLATAAGRMRGLQCLSLSDNAITNDGMHWIMAAICREPWRSGMTRLHLQENPITALPNEVMKGQAISGLINEAERMLREGALPILATEHFQAFDELLNGGKMSNLAVPGNSIDGEGDNSFVFGRLRISPERAILSDGTPPLHVPLGVRNTDRLFVRLARARGTALRAIDLIDDLWPGDSSKTAKAVQNEISKLRDWLEQTGLARFVRVPDAERGVPHYRLEQADTQE